MPCETNWLLLVLVAVVGAWVGVFAALLGIGLGRAAKRGEPDLDEPRDHRPPRS